MTSNQQTPATGGIATELLRLYAACESRGSDSRTSVVPGLAAGGLSDDVGDVLRALALLPADDAQAAAYPFLRILRRLCACMMDPGGPSAAEIDVETLTLALIGCSADQQVDAAT
jgi:hypothetical protein